MSLFNPDKSNFSGNRWDGYTSDHWKGSGKSNDRVQKRNVQQNNQQNENDRSGERGRERSFRDKSQKIWECGIAIHGWSEEEHNGIIRMIFIIPTIRMRIVAKAYRGLLKAGTTG